MTLQMFNLFRDHCFGGRKAETMFIDEAGIRSAVARWQTRIAAYASNPEIESP